MWYFRSTPTNIIKRIIAACEHVAHRRDAHRTLLHTKLVSVKRRSNIFGVYEYFVRPARDCKLLRKVACDLL